MTEPEPQVEFDIFEEIKRATDLFYPKQDTREWCDCVIGRCHERTDVRCKNVRSKVNNEWVR